MSSLVGPGFYPPVMHQLSLPEDSERWGVDRSYTMTHSAETMAKVKGVGRGKKYNLMSQVIPIYGFGILLYILYIIYKVITITVLHDRQVEYEILFIHFIGYLT